MEGNYHAHWKVRIMKKVIKLAGFEPERLRMEFVSSAEGEKYVKIATEFIHKIKELGPIKKQEKKEKTKLEALQSIVSDYRFRAIAGKVYKMVEKENVYGDKISPEEMEKIVETTIESEFIRNSILLLVKESPKSCQQLAKEIGILPHEALNHIIYLRRKNYIDVDKVEERTPLYKRI
jgi:coenzyme F420-reducing hydrogenase delta subunit